MRKLFKVTVLTLVLALPAFAGEMGSPIAPPPGGRQAPACTDPTKTGEMGAPLAASEISITLLQTLLALF